MKKNRIILVLVLIVVFVSYLVYSRLSMNKYGVYTIAKIAEWEVAEQGSNLHLDVYFKGKVYKSIIDGSGYKTGDFYFVQVSSEDPTKIGEVYTKVPACILNAPLPPEGWKSIPKCK